jgi:hypothetical protein
MSKLSQKPFACDVIMYLPLQGMGFNPNNPQAPSGPHNQNIPHMQGMNHVMSSKSFSFGM